MQNTISAHPPLVPTVYRNRSSSGKIIPRESFHPCLIIFKFHSSSRPWNLYHSSSSETYFPTHLQSNSTAPRALSSDPGISYGLSPIRELQLQASCHLSLFPKIIISSLKLPYANPNTNQNKTKRFCRKRHVLPRVSRIVTFKNTIFSPPTSQVTGVEKKFRWKLVQLVN